MTFPDAQMSRMQTTARSRWLKMAQARAVAGPVLNVRRATGAGRETRPVEATIGTVSGYVYSPSRQQITTPAAPDYTPTDEERFVSGTGVITPAADPPLIVEGDTLVDPDEPTIGYHVRGMEPLNGPFVAIVHKVTV